MGTARIKYNNATDEEGKNRGVNIERSKLGTKERSPDGLLQHNQNSILINIKWYYFKIYEKITMKFY